MLHGGGIECTIGDKAINNINLQCSQGIVVNERQSSESDVRVCECVCLLCAVH